MTNILLVALLCLLTVGLLAIYVKLVEIGNDVSYSCRAVERLKDEIVDDDDEVPAAEEWAVVAGNNSGKTNPPSQRN